MIAIDDKLQADWQAVRAAAGDDWRLRQLELVFVQHAAAPADNATSAAKAEDAAAQGRGWVRFQSAAFEGSAWSGDAGRRGRLLWAEWADQADDISYRLTPDPAGSGASVLHTYRESKAPIAGSTSMLAENISLQGFNGQVLHYRVYWAAPDDDPAALRRALARLVRIERPQQ